MRKSAFSVFVFGIYLMVGGIGFLFIPNICLSILGMQMTQEVWIHIMGWCMFFIGLYYIVAARNELMPFIRWTTYTRPNLIIFLAILVMLGKVEPIIIAFGVIELIGAIWTIMALRSEQAYSTGS